MAPKGSLYNSPRPQRLWFWWFAARCHGHKSHIQTNDQSKLHNLLLVALSEGQYIQLLLLLSDLGSVRYWRGTAGNELEDSSVTIRYKGVCAPYFGLSKISDFGYALPKLRGMRVKGVVGKIIVE